MHEFHEIMKVSLSWDKIFKNGPSKIFGRQPLQNMKVYGLLKARKKWNMFRKITSLFIEEVLKTCCFFSEVPIELVYEKDHFWLLLR